MNIYRKRICLVLPHLDDEFALAPLIKHLARFNEFKVIFCAERKNTSLSIQKQRRKENKSSLNYLGIKYEDVFYINDYYLIEDMKIHLSKKIIYSYLSEMNILFKFDILLTLNLEGGHPDHDSLSLIVKKFSNDENIKAYYFPAYNHRKTLIFIPFSVFKPLKSQEYFFQQYRIKRFSWIASFFVALNYRSEWRAMIKIIPFIIFKVLTSNFILFTEKLDPKSIDWDRSLTYSRYGVDSSLILIN
tara:strand:- start:1951 stop:2685 length:735 start_codon:yes stop_codon:yes gene_type:complete